METAVEAVPAPAPAPEAEPSDEFDRVWVRKRRSREPKPAREPKPPRAAKPAKEPKAPRKERPPRREPRVTREAGDAELGIPDRPPVRSGAIVGVVIGGFLVVGVVLYALGRTLLGSNLGDEGAFPRAPVSPGAAAAIPGVIGEPVRVGTVALKVHAVRTVPGSPEEAPAAGMKWVAVQVEVVNEGDAEASISMLSMFDLVDSGGASYAPTIVGSVARYADGELGVGLRLTGEVVFEIPEDAAAWQLQVLSPDRTEAAAIDLVRPGSATP
jgi:hypothetical protein